MDKLNLKNVLIMLKNTQKIKIKYNFKLKKINTLKILKLHIN